MEKKARVIALYLPQFHPMELNDEWWGKGFTEWTNVAKARPLFKGHYQPKIPADLGFYDLRLPETRVEQAKLAENAGIEGFCYWHYWLGKGKTLLDRPFREVLESGSPNYPFCLGWANHSWTNKSWGKSNTSKAQMLQTYVESEFLDHFYDVLPAFKDSRYIKVDGKPLFLVYAPLDMPDPKLFVETWQSLAKENGLDGIHFVGITSNLLSYKREAGGKMTFQPANISAPAAPWYNEILSCGFDAINSRGQYRAELAEEGRFLRYIKTAVRKIMKYDILTVFDYNKISRRLLVEEDKWENVYPTILPNWDRSPRSGKEACIYHNSTPENFRKHLKAVIKHIEAKPYEHRIAFLMSWNEWGEGNYVEPDLKYGHGYLDVLKEELVND